MNLFENLYNNKLLFSIFVVIVIYFFMNFLIVYYEGYSISNEPCNDKPYIKYDNRYICFDPMTEKEKTISLFNHGQQMCEIVPNGTTMVLKDPLLDNLEYKEKKEELCNPLEVYIK